MITKWSYTYKSHKMEYYTYGVISHGMHSAQVSSQGTTHTSHLNKPRVKHLNKPHVKHLNKPHVKHPNKPHVRHLPCQASEQASSQAAQASSLNPPHYL